MNTKAIVTITEYLSAFCYYLYRNLLWIFSFFFIIVATFYFLMYPYRIIKIFILYQIILFSYYLQKTIFFTICLRGGFLFQNSHFPPTAQKICKIIIFHNRFRIFLMNRLMNHQYFMIQPASSIFLISSPTFFCSKESAISISKNSCRKWCQQ